MRVRVPASSANLGPGFDALGLALGVYLTCTFQRADHLTIQVRGRDANRIPATDDNLIWQTALAEGKKGYSATAGPIVIHGKVLSGLTGCGQYRDEPGCFISAWDARTGQAKDFIS